MKTTKLALKPYKNLSGTTSWRVIGWFLGDRIRKNFLSRQDAVAEKTTLEIRAAQADGGMRATGTFLTDEQLREAASLYMRFKDQSRSLTFCVDYTFANHRAPEESKSLAEAVEAYRRQRKADLGKNLISKPQYDTIRNNLTLLVDAFLRHRVADLTGEKLRAYFSRGDAELKTFNNRRGIVSTFLVFARHEGWLATDPLEKAPAYRISRKQRGTATTLAEPHRRYIDHTERLRVEIIRLVPWRLEIIIPAGSHFVYKRPRWDYSQNNESEWHNQGHSGGEVLLGRLPKCILVTTRRERAYETRSIAVFRCKKKAALLAEPHSFFNGSYYFYQLGEKIES